MYLCVQSIQVFWWCVKVKICWIHKQSRSMTSVWKFTCMIWYMRRQPKISGLRLGWCCCMIWYIIDDKCVKSCMILYDIRESNPKNFGIKAWLLLLVWYMRNAAVYSYHYLFLRFPEVPKIDINHLKRTSKLKQKLIKLCVIYARYVITSPHRFLTLSSSVLILLEITWPPPLILFVRMHI